MSIRFDKKQFEADVIADASVYGSLHDSFVAHCDMLKEEFEDLEYDGVLQHDDDDDPDYSADIAAWNAYAATYPRIEKEVNGVDYGILGVEHLVPDETELNKGAPKLIENRTEWVAEVLSGVNHVPYTRIKMSFANITIEEARAKGYIKGTYKKAGFFKLMKRTTTPATIYHKASFDRDDMIDVTTFNMLNWIKDILDKKLDEEKARAILIGDGRPDNDPDKINEEAIRPIVKEEDLFTIKTATGAKGSLTDDEFLMNKIDTIIAAQVPYEGSSAKFFTTEDFLGDAMLMRDQHGHFMYESEDDLKNELGVAKIVTIPELSSFVDPLAGSDDKTSAGSALSARPILGILVNMHDYSVCTDNGGSRASFGKFDMDYNKEKFLVEERFGGTLTKPYTAVVIYEGELKHKNVEGHLSCVEVDVKDFVDHNYTEDWATHELKPATT